MSGRADMPSPEPGLQVFVNDESGRYLQWRVRGGSDGRPVAILLRALSFESQPDGCVADDATGQLLAGKEKRGVWQVDVPAGRAARAALILPVGRWMHADVEGMALYRASDATCAAARANLASTMDRVCKEGTATWP